MKKEEKYEENGELTPRALWPLKNGSRKKKRIRPHAIYTHKFAMAWSNIPSSLSSNPEDASGEGGFNLITARRHWVES